MWMPHPRNYSRPGWSELWETWSSKGVLAHGMPRESLRSLPTQPPLWFYGFLPLEMLSWMVWMGQAWIKGFFLAVHFRWELQVAGRHRGHGSRSWRCAIRKPISIQTGKSSYYLNECFSGMCVLGEMRIISWAIDLLESFCLLNIQKRVSLYSITWTPSPSITYSSNRSVSFAAFATSVMSTKFWLEVM